MPPKENLCSYYSFHYKGIYVRFQFIKNTKKRVVYFFSRSTINSTSLIFAVRAAVICEHLFTQKPLYSLRYIMINCSCGHQRSKTLAMFTDNGFHGRFITINTRAMLPTGRLFYSYLTIKKLPIHSRQRTNSHC